MKKETTKPKPPVKKKAKAEEAPKARPKYFFREGMTIRDAAERIGLKPKDLIEKLSSQGSLQEQNDLLDEAVTAAIGRALDADVEFLGYEQELRRRAEAETANLLARPPVVTIMGHVDHGKTTLLDAIRSSNLVDKESGGITQHIGAYRVLFNNRAITFVDTPGHEAFTQLRARGAKVTDIVILVIAADDGVMPQTREAISHARAANVPIIVAINKIDKPEANIDRVKQQLSKEGLLVEDWGGQTICVEVSAKEKKNLADLLEMIILLADVIEVKANPRVEAHGVVLEARLDPKKGPLATVIIQHGVLTAGAAFISGTTHGKVRALFDEHGKPLKRAEPAMPVEVLGFAEVPVAGDFFQVVPDNETAKKIVAYRLSKVKKEAPVRPERITLDELFKKIEQGKAKELALIIRADVQGSVEVLRDTLPPLSSDKIKIRILHVGTGNITESDILLASASNAVIIGYNIKPGPKILDMAKKANVEIRSYDIIYRLTEDIGKALAGMLEPVEKEVYLGRAEIRRIFQIPKVGSIAGSYVLDGKITRNSLVRVMRGQQIVQEGRITSLKRIKENATEVAKGLECGIGLDKTKDIQEGDIIVAYVIEKAKVV
ncbi:MAG: translation initiation factor IF-2 [Candidatus Aminicenantes bacterium RBG_19FT_COMBO_58_17]|nr:MAG: translation initiation factor IF-2 [Candidatus Aminicenantes bacterium RBG_19FT_COMBO_58_17]